MNIYNKYNKKTGVYIIKNTIDKRVYIGSAINIFSRIKDHLKELKRKLHKNKYLQNHYNKYGMCYYFDVLEFCSKESLINVEQFMLDKYLSYNRNNGFNINKKANSMYGFNHSEKTKKEWSLKRKGVKFSNEAKKNMSLAKSGSNNSLSKLTENDVLLIRDNFDNKRDYTKKTADRYNVSWHTINYILKRITWKHI